MRDHDREDSGFGREAYPRYAEPQRTDRDDRPLQGSYGEEDQFFGFDRREGGDDRWRHPLLSAGKEVFQAARRAFRGPKGYVRSDERIREDVSDRFSEQDELDPSDIEVSVSGGEVTLSGLVWNRQEKFRAEDIADSVPGVREVHNRLRLRPNLTPQVSTATTDAASARAGGTGDGRDVRP